MPVPSGLLVFAAFIASLKGGSWIQARRRKAKLLEAIQSNWGKPHGRPCSMDVMLDHFRSRAKVETGRDSLDSRTWDDLNLDDVFQALDRTESTLGQQALYFRMRSTWTTDELETFEALVSRASEDVPLRQRAQLSLVSLRDPDGYDVWWLAQPGVVERRSWHVVFPILSATMLALAITATVSPAAILPLAAGALLNVVIRGVRGRRLAPLTIPFRQAATVIATGQALAFLGQRARNALLEPLARMSRDWAGSIAISGGQGAIRPRPANSRRCSWNI